MSKKLYLLISFVLTISLAFIGYGDIRSFTTAPYSVVDDFDSYLNSEELKAVWNDYWVNGTCAEVFTNETTFRSGQSMKYLYENKTYWPYYSEAEATIGIGAGKLNVDPNWFAMGAKALSLWFYGDPCNPVGQHDKMYIKLVDSDIPVHTATVFYGDYGDMNNVRLKKWQEWNIPLADFTDVNLRKVARIVIGFGDGTQAASDGNMFFDDIRLYATRCALSERDPDFARVDYAPLDAVGFPIGDCVVDHQELAIMADKWLYSWEPYPTLPPSPNSIPNLVAYWPMDEGDGNHIYSYVPGDCIIIPESDPYNPCYTGTFSPTGVSWVIPGAVESNAALHFDGNPGTRVSCGNQNPASEANEITLALCAKWLGPRYWDSYLLTKSQGMISKAIGWSESDVMFMFEVDTRGETRSFALRHYETGNPPIHPDLYAPPGILNTYIGRWVHLAATFDGTTAKLYLNGVEVASGPWRFSAGTDANLTIGSNLVYGLTISPESFYGDLDEVCIYNRSLTADEIEYLAYYYKLPPIADLYNNCWECPQEINFKDFAVLANYWLEEDMFP